MTDPLVAAFAHLDSTALGPGNVLLTRSRTPAGKRWSFGRLIRAGAAAEDEPNVVNHVCVLHHRDEHGVWQGLEGRPGGVGWKDCRPYLKDPWTVVNVGQPLTAEQRTAIVLGMEQLLGCPYDWTAIGVDGGMALGLNLSREADWIRPLWLENPGGTGYPGAVVCSSAADVVYERAGAANPGTHATRYTTPADWDRFLIENRWEGRP